MKLFDTAPPRTTFDIEREVPHPLVVAANDAFERIEGHRRLFRRDWLPFINGVFHLSIIAWEQTGSRTTLDGKPDWTYDPTQVVFRELTKDLPWARYIEARRTAAPVLRRIGKDRERFLGWYDGLDKSIREHVGRPKTLWRKFEQNTKREAVTEDEKAVTARSDSKDEKAVTVARSDTEDDKAVAARSKFQEWEGRDRRSVRCRQDDCRRDVERGLERLRREAA